MNKPFETVTEAANFIADAFRNMERCEFGVWEDRDSAIALFTLQALANPDNDWSRHVLNMTAWRHGIDLTKEAQQ